MWFKIQVEFKEEKADTLFHFGSNNFYFGSRNPEWFNQDRGNGGHHGDVQPTIKQNLVRRKR